MALSSSVSDCTGWRRSWLAAARNFDLARSRVGFRLGGSQIALDLLAANEIVDVGAGAEPFLDLAVFIGQRYAADQPPAVFSIRPTQPAFKRIDLVVSDGFLPGVPRSLLVLGMKGLVPAVPVTLLQRKPSVLHPFLIEKNVPAIRSRRPDDLGMASASTRNSPSLFCLPQSLLGKETLGAGLSIFAARSATRRSSS